MSNFACQCYRKAEEGLILTERKSNSVWVKSEKWDGKLLVYADLEGPPLLEV